MPRIENFDRRSGKLFLPIADKIRAEFAEAMDDDDGVTVLKEGCYAVTYRPIGPQPGSLRFFPGTIRVENITGGIRFSGDLYHVRLNIDPAQPTDQVERLRLAHAEEFEENSADGGLIPIFQREDYHSYLLGTIASLSSPQSRSSPCRFSLSFNQFIYQHPATGFNGSFPSAPNRTVRLELQHTDTADRYVGSIFEDSTQLGTVSIRWVSRFFRRATLVVHNLQGAEQPPSVPITGGGAEDFRTVFATAGWDLTVTNGGEVPLPPALVGVQDPNECWPSANSHTLMQSLPGYNPDELDHVWRAHLIAIPTRIGCSRGRMFDNRSNDLNDVPREGAVTHSHDGYPNNPNFGVAEDGQQKDFPRAFLRSAAHEVGHTFNQIHQTFEGGRDNSIMTVTPSVANVLASGGQTFPDDINLGFNEKVRRHLIHLPDPAVRPGAIEFFGAAVTSPEADEIEWPSSLHVDVQGDRSMIGLGEPLLLSWKLSNEGEQSILAPAELDTQSMTARVSVTNPRGEVTFMRPVDLTVCFHNPLNELAPSKTREGQATVFWGSDGFAFKEPGRHTVEVILLWQVNNAYVGAADETTVWVSYPVTAKENEVAALLLDDNVGGAIARGRTEPKSIAEQRIHKAIAAQPKNSVCAKKLKTMFSDLSGVSEE